MTEMNFVQIWKMVIQNDNKWVVFEYGTIVIFLPKEILPDTNLRNEAIKRLKELNVRDVAVAELVGQGRGWIVNCGNDYILNYLPHGDYKSRYDRIAGMIDIQKLDQKELKVIYVEK